MKKTKRIFLLGFMGTGKSVVAIKLAKKLGWQCLELDKTIEEHLGITIPETFETKGEDFFRETESKVLEAVTEENIVVSCGGGIILRESNVEFMKNNGVTVLLTATPEIIYKRINNSKNRPVLKDKMSIEGIESVLEVRQAKYKNAAQVTVQTDDKSIADIVKDIIRKIEEGA